MLSYIAPPTAASTPRRLPPCLTARGSIRSPHGTPGGSAKIGEDITAGHPSSGGFVDLAITQRCNQRCVFCYEEKRGGPGEMALEEVRRLIREAAATHESIVLCGKEALLRPDILEVIRYARGLDRRVVAFTNGQVLARPGFIPRLVEAGLSSVAISFHFPDAEVFAAGAQVRPQMFARILRGLNLLRDHNRAHPEARLEATVETDLFDLNRGRLKEMRSLLQRELGETFRAYTLGGMTPVNLAGGVQRPMLEPLDERRAELADFLATNPPHLRLRFTKTALCLLPGHEHLSLEAQYRLSAARIRHNLYDAATMVDDDQTVSASHDFDDALRQNPYRWLCRTCSLVRLCRSARTAWYAPNFLPTREQRPHPVRDTTPADVLARWAALEPDRAACADLAEVSAPVGGETPEERLLALLSRPGADGISLADAWLSGRRALDVELRRSGRRLDLHLGLPAEPRRELGFVVGGLDVVPTLHDATPDDLYAALERLAAPDRPGPQAWASDRGLTLEPARVLAAAWERLGRRLWPGLPLAGSLVTATARLSGGTVGLTATDPGGARVDVTYTPVFDRPEGPPRREILTATRPGAPGACPPAPGLGGALAALFPPESTTLRGPATWHGRGFDVILTCEARRG